MVGEDDGDGQADEVDCSKTGQALQEASMAVLIDDKSGVVLCQLPGRPDPMAEDALQDDANQAQELALGALVLMPTMPLLMV